MKNLIYFIVLISLFSCKRDNETPGLGQPNFDNQEFVDSLQEIKPGIKFEYDEDKEIPLEYEKASKDDLSSYYDQQYHYYGKKVFVEPLNVKISCVYFDECKLHYHVKSSFYLDNFDQKVSIEWGNTNNNETISELLYENYDWDSFKKINYEELRLPSSVELDLSREGFYNIEFNSISSAEVYYDQNKSVTETFTNEVISFYGIVGRIIPFSYKAEYPIDFSYSQYGEI